MRRELHYFTLNPETKDWWHFVENSIVYLLTKWKFHLDIQTEDNIPEFSNAKLVRNFVHCLCTRQERNDIQKWTSLSYSNYTEQTVYTKYMLRIFIWLFFSLFLSHFFLFLVTMDLSLCYGLQCLRYTAFSKSRSSTFKSISKHILCSCHFLNGRWTKKIIRNFA